MVGLHGSRAATYLSRKSAGLNPNVLKHLLKFSSHHRVLIHFALEGQILKNSKSKLRPIPKSDWSDRGPKPLENKYPTASCWPSVC